MPTYPDNNFEGSLDEFLSRMLGNQGFGNRSANISSLLSQKSNDVVQAAARKAATRNHPSVEALHLLSVLVNEPAVIDIIDGLHADRAEIQNNINRHLTSNGAATKEQIPPLGPSAHSTLFEAAQIAKMLGSSLIEPEHMFYSITAHPETTHGILTRAGITMENVREHTINSYSETEGARQGGQKTPTLDQYSTDLTAMARDGKIDPVIGRANEVTQTMEILLRRTKNNPVLIGEPGVGKTAIVEGLAQAIVDGTVPELLKGKRLVSLDLPGMVAGSKFRGEFEERITKVINEVVANKDEIILFLDEIHTVIGAGGGGEQGGMDAGNILKPRLARGELHLIGATTLKEYRRIEKDAAFERRFQPVTVGEPSIEDAIAILDGVKKKYEEHHGASYTNEAIVSAVDLSNRYISDHFLPDKAIDLIDQAGARKRLNAGPAVDMQALQQRIADLEQEKNAAVAREQYEAANELKLQIDATKQQIDDAIAGNKYQSLTITDTDIAEVIANKTGIPVAKLTESDRNRLSHLEDELHESVIGQDEAVSTVARSVRRNRSGMADATKPIGSFLFLGPTGVGKTALAKTLAHNLFGSENALIRFDMSEFSEKHTASRLVGAPPGYVGYEEAGQLTEKVRRNPYSVILLDEIEKAHPDLFNILLQVLDDGRLTDGQGRTVDFRNTVIIMTSNIGGEFMASKSGAIGFISGAPEYSDDDIRIRVMGKLRDMMRPEFLNRIDEVVLFKKLDLAQIEQITQIVLLESAARLAAQGINLTYTEEAVRWLAENGHDAEYGARPLRRLIQRQVDDKVADLIINEEVVTGGEVKIDVVGTNLHIQVTAPVEDVKIPIIA